MKKVLALYLRLSNEDSLKENNITGESMSIANQRDLLTSEIAKKSDLAEYKIQEYVDDGYSGSNFKRPGFQKMMEDVRSGSVKCIMVKDFSRFARNFLDMSEYMEQIFPFMGIRFISINDLYDSELSGYDAGAWDIAFKNLLNDLYCKDISRKIRATRVAKAKRGEYNGAPPLGYQYVEEEKGKLVLEPEGAKMVRFIFDRTLEGFKVSEIARMLNEKGFLTPARHSMKLNPEHKRRFRQTSENRIWDYQSVHQILCNRAYTGACISMKRTKTGPCSPHTKRNSKEDWIIVPNRFEAIISEDDFERAQTMWRTKHNVRPRKYTPTLPNEDALKGFVTCGYCGRKMSYVPRKTIPSYYFCKLGKFEYRENGDEFCDGREYSAEKLRKVVLDAIKKMADLTGKKLAAAKMAISQGEDPQKRIDLIQQEINKLKREKMELYEQYAAGQINKQAYLSTKTSLDDRASILLRESEKLELLSSKDTALAAQIEKAAGYSAQQELTTEIVRTLVKEVKVYKNDRIEIVWNFKSVFE